MLSGGTNSIQPPAKPWEILSPPNNFEQGLMTEICSPPPPPPPLPSNLFQEHSNMNSTNYNWPGSGNYFGGGGYGRYSYPSSYNSGYNSFSSPYTMNGGPFSGGGPPAPGNYLTSSLESTTRPLFDSLNHILQAINHVACFVDSTVFAVWTSITAAGSIITVIKNFKNIYIRKCIEAVSKLIKNIKTILKTTSGRKKLIVFASIFAAIPIAIKALHFLLKIEESQDNIIMSLDSCENTSSLAAATFVRAIYSYNPSDKTMYLPINPGDVILITKEDESKISTSNPMWIAGKLKDGSTGYFPSNYVTVIK